MSVLVGLPCLWSKNPLICTTFFCFNVSVKCKISWVASVIKLDSINWSLLFFLTYKTDNHSFDALLQTQYSVLLTDDGAELFLQQSHPLRQCRACHDNTAWFSQSNFLKDLEKTLLIKYIWNCSSEEENLLQWCCY